jgi:hypothetical protein
VRGSGTNGRLPSQQHPDDDNVNAVGKLLDGGVLGEDKTIGVVVETAAVAEVERRCCGKLTTAVADVELVESSRLLLLLLQLPLLIAPCRQWANTTTTTTISNE